MLLLFVYSQIQEKLVFNHGFHITLKNTNYGFTYDGLNRLSEATYAENVGTGFTTNLNAYDEFGIKCDITGNVLTLKRNIAGTFVDNLVYPSFATRGKQSHRL